MSKSGRFIVFEGGEGAGKSTQARRLAERLGKMGIDTVLTREPGGSPGAEAIRALLVQGAGDRWDPLAETLLFLAARADHVERVIRPALAAGRWVICDRFSDSTIVYQGVARGLGLEKVQTLQKEVLGDFAPDLTFVLDLDPAAGLARAAVRGQGEDRFENFDTEFHASLRRAFRDLAGADPVHKILVNTARSVDTIAAELWAALEARWLA